MIKIIFSNVYWHYSLSVLMYRKAVNQSIHPSIHQSINQSINDALNRSFNISSLEM